MTQDTKPRKLHARGVRAAALHGELSQSQRRDVLHKLAADFESAVGTVDARATIVTSSPGRTTAASPSVTSCATRSLIKSVKLA